MVVRIVRAGKTTRFEHYDLAPRKGASIYRLDDEHYVVLSTGEIREYVHSENRGDNNADAYRRLRLSMRDMRDVVNANAIDGTDILWVTLTYAENMTDRVQLYEDYRRYWQRFKRWLLKNGGVIPEYVVAAEPQERGAWHLHCLYFFHGCKAPWVDNDKLRNIWGHGFVKIDKVNTDVITNIGAYLSAYMTDTLKGGKKNKGGRLKLYPPRMRFWRASRGAYRPSVEWVSDEEAEIKKDSPSMGVLSYHSKKIIKLRDGRSISLVYDHYTA